MLEMKVSLQIIFRRKSLVNVTPAVLSSAIILVAKVHSGPSLFLFLQASLPAPPLSPSQLGQPLLLFLIWKPSWPALAWQCLFLWLNLRLGSSSFSPLTFPYEIL